MNAVLELSTTDGRWLRSVRTRAAIITAWLELIEEGDISPTAKGVADRAGIGLRTVFQHFSDMNALHRAAGEEMVSRITPSVVHIPADLPLSERIALMAASRGQLFEQLTGLRRACERQEWLSEDIRKLIDDWEQLGTASTLRIFATELAALDPADRALVGMALDAASSWATWNQLRHRRSLSIADSQAVVERSLQLLLR